ncbi:NAD(P)-dependent oxidoreductase [Dactylosporangium sp. AC04546]|uniref:NAD-dependent epimerase/dehydratase family protein n=1 Tax=Dactylosporangium sp. AC04546 TaxID=2862460 RepID=UPI001EDE2DD4|nr:NAD(P)-dependent oxidoreductase [Dactylosporangium sp. AC04546]WVK81210.1 NAD(P)-dependent oxidoreductase [Dactylosporangium sp. AC04546]
MTGAGGMLGRAVVAGLHAAGHTVRAHDLSLVDSVADDTVAGDLRTSDGLDRLVAGVDAVVHTAAIPAPVHDDVFDNNVTSTYRLLEAAGPAGVARIVYVSSLSAVGLAWSSRGASPLSLPLTEDHPYVGDDPYGLSKQAGELVTATASNRWGIPAASLRFPFIGTGARLRHHLTHVGEDLSRDRGGLWAWIDTRDAVSAVAAALTRPLSGHTVLHVAAPDTTAALPTQELLARYHPHVPVTSALPAHTVPVATARGHELLGFTPAHGWRDHV